MITAYKHVFARIEKKYLITRDQLGALLPVLNAHMHGDKYGLSTVSSMYFDTPDMRIIRASIEATRRGYKEKLRLRCYGTPSADSPAFVELKKKYLGTVYKRRFEMPYEEALAFLTGRAEAPDTQMGREVAYVLDLYPGIRPMIDIFCDRLALFGNDDEELRVTFDSAPRYRMTDLDLRNGSEGRSLLEDDLLIMEIKSPGAMPLWLAELLDENGVYPQKFSKYAAAFNIELKERLGLK